MKDVQISSNSKYILIFTDSPLNLLYILYNKAEFDVYEINKNYMTQDNIHNEYHLFYNIFSLSSNTNIRIVKARVTYNRIITLSESVNGKILNIYDFEISDMVHDTKISHM